MSTAVDNLEIGQRFPSRTKRVTQEMMTRYIDTLASIYAGKRVSSGSNIHTDDAYARSQGLQGAVADGMISTALLSALMVDLFGEAYLQGGSLSTTYLKPIYAGDTLTLKAAVKEMRRENSHTRVVLDVGCDNQKGEMVTVGTASALMKGSPKAESHAS